MIITNLSSLNEDYYNEALSRAGYKEKIKCLYVCVCVWIYGYVCIYVYVRIFVYWKRRRSSESVEIGSDEVAL